MSAAKKAAPPAAKIAPLSARLSAVLDMATMRDLRLRASVRGEADPAHLEAALEALEDLVGFAQGSTFFEDTIAIETPADLVEAFADAVAKAEEREEQAEKDREAALSEIAKREDEADEKVRVIDATCRELTKRAERAEHDIAAAVKNGHGLDAELHKRIADQERTIKALGWAAALMDPDDVDALILVRAVLGQDEHMRLVGERQSRRNARLEHDRADLVRVTAERDALAEQVRILRERKPLKRRGAT